MPRDDLARLFVEHILDACELFERRQVTETGLRVALDRNATGLQVIEPDAARVYHSFVHLLDAVVQSGAPEQRWVELCAVVDRIREFSSVRTASS